VKKCYYDILFNKEGEDKINSKVVLIIQDFDLDQAQKMSNELYNTKYMDINMNPDIEEKLDDIYYNMIKEKSDNDKFAQDKINEHLKIDFDMFGDNKNFGGINRNFLSSEINIAPEGKMAWFYSGTKIENFKELSNEEDIMNIHEIAIKNVGGEENEENFNENENKIEITEDKLRNLGFKNMLGNNKIREKYRGGYDFLQKRRERDNVYRDKYYGENGKYFRREQNDLEQNKKLIKTLPIEIQNLIIKMKKKEVITLNKFEKYKAYKKLNANEYKKEKIN
jgi:hypothetical protein